MTFRFLHFGSLYPAFERQFLAANQDCATLDYQEVYNRLLATKYSMGDVFVRHLRARGSAAEYHCASLEPLQKAWARKYGLRYGQRTWLRDIVLAQIRHFQPDVIFFQDTSLFDRQYRVELRKNAPGQPLMVGWRSSPTKNFGAFTDLDVVFTAGPHFVTAFRRHGVNAFLLPLAFDDSVLARLPPAEDQDLPFTFVGTVGSPNGSHAMRYTVIEHLLEAGLVEVWGDEPQNRAGLLKAARKAAYQINRSLERIGISRVARTSLPVIGRAADWQRDPEQPTLRDRFSDRMHAAIFGLDAFQILHRSRMTLNCHIGAASTFAGNNRLYEATGVGACLVTDWKEDLNQYFALDEEVVTYRCAEECAAKVKYLLTHDSERRAIATAGQHRTLRDHTYANRTQKLMEVITSVMDGDSDGRA